MLSKIAAFVRREVVLSVSALAALLSMLLTPPSAVYASYIDWNVLMLLFSLMAVVAGLRRSGLWDAVSSALLRRASGARSLAVLLVALCFFSAMLVTNDVALITFVPLCFAVLGSAGPGCVISAVVFMTIAANLGSMSTPIGNPQNLYLYSAYGLSFGEFEAAILPLAALSAALVLLGCMTIRGKSAVRTSGARPPLDRPRLALHGILFALCLLSVLEVLPVWAAFACTAAACLALDRPALRQVDHSLLLTFVFFFILAGNLAASEAVRSFIGARLRGNELLFGAGVSQLISNVPAAVLLSSFTENWKPLLLGVNIGGLGTPVASLASLISYRLYARSEGAQKGRYMAAFLLWNALYLAVLLGAALVLFR
ncbi:MAG: SLC13 family permease [Eubacteriales bacterium]|nr:SLC13 family permease [Eubacteriales bacterium]